MEFAEHLPKLSVVSASSAFMGQLTEPWRKTHEPELAAEAQKVGSEQQAAKRLAAAQDKILSNAVRTMRDVVVQQESMKRFHEATHSIANQMAAFHKRMEPAVSMHESVRKMAERFAEQERALMRSADAAKTLLKMSEGAAALNRYVSGLSSTLTPATTALSQWFAAVESAKQRLQAPRKAFVDELSPRQRAVLDFVSFNTKGFTAAFAAEQTKLAPVFVEQTLELFVRSGLAVAFRTEPGKQGVVYYRAMRENDKYERSGDAEDNATGEEGES